MLNLLIFIFAGEADVVTIEVVSDTVVDEVVTGFVAEVVDVVVIGFVVEAFVAEVVVDQGDVDIRRLADLRNADLVDGLVLHDLPHPVGDPPLCDFSHTASPSYKNA